jgi:cell wall-associated NlpC family hydrolase
MPRFTAEQIYAFARQAGFSPDQSATMTAIALAESGGDSRSHATIGEDSRGLWQVNAAAHPDLANQFDLYDPAQNAKAAFLASHNGTDVSPWTTTHGGLAARYLRFRDDAQAAAMAYGDGPNRGVWTGTIGYGHPLSPGDPHGGKAPTHDPTDTHTDGSAAVVVGANPASVTVDGHGGDAYGIPLDDQSAAHFGIPLDGAPDPSTPAADPHGVTVAAGNDHLRTFLDSALAQRGDRYIFGVMDRLDDPNPGAFDCSMLVQWSAHQAGTDLQRNAWHQYQQLHDQGMTIPVQDAIHTPGALLFSFNSDPNGSNAPVHQHVAISLGNGKTIEALGAQYGVNEFDATTKRFQYAAVIPGISDHVGPTGPLPDHPVAVPAPADPHPATAPAADPHPVPAPVPPDHHDPFLARLAVDPDALDTGHGTGTPATPAVIAPPVEHHDDVPPAPPPVSVDADGDGLDDSLQDAGTEWSVPHHAVDTAHYDDGWDGGHHH